MKCFQQTFRVEGLVAATVGLMFLATGCETVEHYSLTYKLWNNDDFRKHSEPALSPNLTLFDAEERRDILVQYDALSEKHSAVKRRAYFLQPNRLRIPAAKKPRFVNPAVAGGMRSIPVLNSQTVATPAAQQPATYAITAKDGRGFALYRQSEAQESFELPIYAESSGAFTRVVLTPFAVAGDTVMVGAVASVAGFFVWLNLGAPGANVH